MEDAWGWATEKKRGPLTSNGLIAMGTSQEQAPGVQYTGSASGGLVPAAQAMAMKQGLKMATKAPPAWYTPEVAAGVAPGMTQGIASTAAMGPLSEAAAAAAVDASLAGAGTAAAGAGTAAAGAGAMGALGAAVPWVGAAYAADKALGLGLFKRFGL